MEYSTLLATELDFGYVANNFAKYEVAESFHVDKNVQCNLIVEKKPSINPKTLTYKRRILWHLKEFCYKTSSHGILMLGIAPNSSYRYVWTALLTISLSMFLLQAISVIAKYHRNEKITNIELIFDTAPFPAITICNLNPYMQSKIEYLDVVKRVFKVFNDAMVEASVKNSLTSRTDESDNIVDKGKYEAVWSSCNCRRRKTGVDCFPNMDKNPALENDQLCLCAFDTSALKIRSCYPNDDWELETCKNCSAAGFCEISEEDPESDYAEQEECLCQNYDNTCIKYNSEYDPMELWKFFKDNNLTSDANIIEAMGFQNMRDEVAIVTRARENMIFAMAELPKEDQATFSTGKRQLIHKCSFNGVECNIEKDFKLVQDPTYGNCYTFNHNRTENKTTIRAGPMYGLRMLLFVNASEYLPITEAVGIKITIHDKDEFPFPDTFGYNAPTGYISSFGMRMSKVARLPEPFSDCVNDNHGEDHSSGVFRYSTEGCYRNCIQKRLIQECGCGDPRYPVHSSERHCRAFDPIARKCLQEQTKKLSRQHEGLHCRCQQPCSQSIFTVSYSAGIWPSEALNITVGDCEDEPEICIEQYQENGAMIEVFYEALNYEIMTESEAYGLVKLLSDFGGQLGLWSGISFITCCEFVFLLLEVLQIVFNHYLTRYRQLHSANNKPT